MILGIIPARRGSKGLPGKNMVDLNGRPLLDYTLTTAEACRGLGRIILSTDMPDAIAWTKRHYTRVEVPFVRPRALSGPSVTLDKVVLHSVDFLEDAGHSVDAVVLLQPTCPFRTLKEVESAIHTFERRGLESLVGVCRAWHHPSDYIYRNPAKPGTFQFVFRKPSWKQRQDFPPVFFMTGALHICRVEYLRRTHRFYDRRSHLFQMSQDTMVDIDTPFDLEIARRIVTE